MSRLLISLAMKQIPILRSIEQVPGGLMVFPMLSPSADGSSTTEGSATAPTRREPH